MKPLFKTKRMCIATLLALVMVVAVGATLALMASSPQFLTNTFAAADVNTDVDEETGDNNEKTVWVENNGKSPVYVRARIMVSGVNPESIKVVTAEPNADNIDPYALYLVMPNVNDATEGTGKAAWSTSPAQNTEEDDSYPYTDEFYYYLGVLQPGTSTSNLMTKVIIGEELRNSLLVEDEEAGKTDFADTFNITIYHESVLAIGDEPGIELSDVVEAFETADGNTTSSTTP